MKSVNWTIFLLVVALSGCATSSTSFSHSNKGELYTAVVNDKNPRGKDLIMKFEETSRESNYSIAKVRFTSGASVPSSMFIMNGFYTIAKQRNAKYFVKFKEWSDTEGNRLYKVGFANSKSINIEDTFGSDIDTEFPGIMFLSVKEYQKIFRN